MKTREGMNEELRMVGKIILVAEIQERGDVQEELAQKGGISPIP